MLGPFQSSPLQFCSPRLFITLRPYFYNPGHLYPSRFFAKVTSENVGSSLLILVLPMDPVSPEGEARIGFGLHEAYPVVHNLSRTLCQRYSFVTIENPANSASPRLKHYQNIAARLIFCFVRGNDYCYDILVVATFSFC